MNNKKIKKIAENAFQYNEWNINDPDIYMLGRVYSKPEPNINNPNTYLIHDTNNPIQQPIQPSIQSYSEILRQLGKETKYQTQNS
jgi:hypothetical protein